MIKVGIITGATGIGKSTYLSNLVQTLPPYSHTIIISHRHANSFGLETTNITPPTMESNSTISHYQVFDFGSGCICCSPDGDLTRLLSELDTKYKEQKLKIVF